MGAQITPSGPDFGKGVALAALGEGALTVGQVSGEPILVIRRGKDVYAFGAACTHYGANLADGIVEGDTIRCPWHHARFNYRTGEPGAPAFNALPCWQTEVRGDQVFVTRRKESAFPAVGSARPESVVIVGGGAAGHSAAEELRRLGYTGPITVLSAEAGLPCDRPNLSKDYLAGNCPEEWIPLRGADHYTQEKIDLRLATRVVGVQPKEHQVSLADGKSVRYGALLLATGGSPNRLSLPGAQLPHVRYLRDFADTRAIVERLPGVKQAVVIGASFIGLEVAASLRTRGLDVHVVGPEAVPLERVVGKEVGTFVRQIHEEKGVHFHLEQKPKEITPQKVILENGTSIEAQLVVAGIGVRPDVTLAQEAGLDVDNGILVNEYLETSQSGIFAAGDVARYRDTRSGQLRRIEHWMVAQSQARTAARNILGLRQPYLRVPFFWSAHFDVTLNYVGYANPWDQAQILGSLSARDAAIVYRHQGKIGAVTTVNRDKLSLHVEAAMEKGDEKALEQLVRG